MNRNGLYLALLGFVIFFTLMGVLNHYLNSEREFIFMLNGVEMDKVEEYHELWRYENLTIIPCTFNNQIGGLPQDLMNYSLSPQENCESYDGEFIGFNVKNETRAEELFDAVYPNILLKSSEITEEWLIENAMCIKLNWFDKCVKWRKNNLIVEVRS